MAARRRKHWGEARDLLRELITTMMREGKALPEPSQTDEKRHLVVPPGSDSPEGSPLRSVSGGRHVANAD